MTRVILPAKGNATFDNAPGLGSIFPGTATSEAGALVDWTASTLICLG
jgi:hypothetical protein